MRECNKKVWGAYFQDFIFSINVSFVKFLFAGRVESSTAYDTYGGSNDTEIMVRSTRLSAI